MDSFDDEQRHAARVQAVRWRIARRHLNRRRSHKLLWAVSLLLTFLVLAMGATGAGAYYFVSNLPSAAKFHIHYSFQNARIFDSRGNLLDNMADLRGQNTGRRMVEPLQPLHDSTSPCRGGVDSIPLLLQNATIATEDATFYKNPGFDPLSMVRAAYQDLSTGHILSGASTITQQVVRNNHLVGDQQTLLRKAQEVALAYEVSKKFSKRKILWFYLNSVPYGNTAIGAQAAAQVYFHQRVCRLDLAQAALLAGLPRAPSLYDPVLHRGAALARMRQVLGLMKLHGDLPGHGRIAALMAEARRWTFSLPQANIRYPQFVRYVLDQVQTMPKIRNQLYAGIDIYTTLDPRLQDLAQNTVTNQIDSLAAQHVTDGALVSLDLRPAHYGWILAMVGSAHYRGQAGQINMAVQPRQPGSSMKPFNYIWAFQHGAGPGTTVVDAPIILPDPNDTQNHGWYMPTNYDHQFHGQVTLRQALANSLNIPAVKVEYYITGSQHVAGTAYRFGMHSLYRDNPGLSCSVCYSVTLGGLARGTRLLEETAAYGVFATGGVTVPPVAIWKVVKRGNGKVLFCSADCPRRAHPAPWIAHARKQVLDPGHAFEMTDVLADNSARCTPSVCEFGLISPLLLDRPAGVKTGTTNAFTDNWTVGYTPQIVTGVWTGNADRTPMVNVIGVTGAAPIWHDYMEAAFKVLRLPVLPFNPPAGVVTTPQCSTPNSTYPSSGFNDIWVQADPLPLCRLPERGEMPVSCAQYPPPQPFGWECPAVPAYTYGPGYTTTFPGGTGTGTGTGPINGYPTSTVPFGGPATVGPVLQPTAVVGAPLPPSGQLGPPGAIAPTPVGAPVPPAGQSPPG